LIGCKRHVFRNLHHDESPSCCLRSWSP
jgi:hypothetical protein